MERLTLRPEGELNIKRFYIKGAVKTKCPHCSNMIEHNFDIHYLSYPAIGEDTTVYFVCDNCDKEWTAPMKIKDIRIDIEVDLDKIEED